MMQPVGALARLGSASTPFLCLSVRPVRQRQGTSRIVVEGAAPEWKFLRSAGPCGLEVTRRRSFERPETEWPMRLLWASSRT